MPSFPLQLIVYVLSAFGLAYIVGHSTISKAAREFVYDLPAPPFRWFVLMVECPACFGFWIGIASGFAGVFDPVFYGRRLTAALIVGCFTAGTNLVLARLAGLLPTPMD